MEAIWGILGIVWLVLMLKVPFWIFEMKNKLRQIVGENFDGADLKPKGIAGYLLEGIEELKQQNAMLAQEIAQLKQGRTEDVPF